MNLQMHQKSWKLGMLTRDVILFRLQGNLGGESVVS